MVTWSISLLEYSADRQGTKQAADLTLSLSSTALAAKGKDRRGGSTRNSESGQAQGYWRSVKPMLPYVEAAAQVLDSRPVCR